VQRKLTWPLVFLGRVIWLFSANFEQIKKQKMRDKQELQMKAHGLDSDGEKMADLA
jgi:hypothetical protein